MDESPAIVWLKDLDGRYLRVNRRYVEQLGTDAEHVCGRTDAELTAAGSIEGLRLEERDTAGPEPLELEYRIGAFEDRPAFAALRFALRDADGQPTAICGVAAPARERLARSFRVRAADEDRSLGTARRVRDPSGAARRMGAYAGRRHSVRLSTVTTASRRSSRARRGAGDSRAAGRGAVEGARAARQPPRRVRTRCRSAPPSSMAPLRPSRRDPTSSSSRCSRAEARVSELRSRADRVRAELEHHVG